MSSVAPAAAPAAPHAFAEILREASFRRLWLSGLCVNGARWMDLVLLGWLAFQFTDSPFMVAVAAFARSAPMMLLGPFTGLVADRMHRGRVLVFTQVLGLVTGLALAAVFAAMQSTLVLLAAPADSRGRAMGILSACIGTQPAGTLWIGFLATGIGVPAAMALNGVVALLAMLPAAWPLARRGRG